MGGAFIIGSLFEELGSEIKWDPGLLGAGASLVAIGIAIYALLIQTERKEAGASIGGSGKGKDNLEGIYVWVERIKKCRCEYCRDSGRHRYYKTLSGIKGHIAREHVKREVLD
jgi:hypothetical protein